MALLARPVSPPLSVLDLRYQMQLVIWPVTWRRGCARQWDWCYPVDPVLREATPRILLSYLEPVTAASCISSSARSLMPWDIQGAVMIQLTGLGAGCCQKRVVVPFSACAFLVVEPCHFPCATSACLTLEWVSLRDRPAENHIKNEWVFLMRERGKVEISVLCSLWNCRLSGTAALCSGVQYKSSIYVCKMSVKR